MSLYQTPARLLVRASIARPHFLAMQSGAILYSGERAAEGAVSLLLDIQRECIEGDAPLGQIFLKLQFLASRLGSNDLEEWVNFENAGYPSGAEVPAYRHLRPAYRCNLHDGIQGYSNVPIAPYLIEKHCGDRWKSISIRDSVAAIEDLSETETSDGNIYFDTGNLVLLINHAKVFNFPVIEVQSFIAQTHFREMKHAIKSRLLSFCLELEKRVPAAREVILSTSIDKIKNEGNNIRNLFQQTIHGNYVGITSAGDKANIESSIAIRDIESVVQSLSTAGVPEQAAREFAEILSKEAPESADEPFGEQAKQWVIQAIGKAATGAWHMGMSTAQRVLTDAALRYYGLN